MAGPFADVFLPQLAQGAGAGALGALQGLTQAPFAAEDLTQRQQEAAMRALSLMAQRQTLPLELQQQQLAFQQAQKMFPLQLRGEEAKASHLEAQSEKERALAALYAGGGLMPARTVEEQAKRLMAAGDFGNPIVQNYLRGLQESGLAKPTAGEKEAKTAGMPLLQFYQKKSELRPTVTEIVDPTDQKKTVKIDAKTGKVIGEAPRWSPYGQVFRTKESLMKYFASGIGGRSIIANNTAINHLALLKEHVQALKAGDIRVINAIEQRVMTELGLSSAPKTFDAIRRIAAAEIVKTVAAAGGGVEERAAEASDFDKALPPDILLDVLDGKIDILKGKTDAMRGQYEAFGLETELGPFNRFLSPGAKKEAPSGKISPKGEQAKKTVFEREYDKLKRIHPDWSREQLFTELSRQGF